MYSVEWEQHALDQLAACCVPYGSSERAVPEAGDWMLGTRVPWLWALMAERSERRLPGSATVLSLTATRSVCLASILEPEVPAGGSQDQPKQLANAPATMVGSLPDG